MASGRNAGNNGDAPVAADGNQSEKGSERSGDPARLICNENVSAGSTVREREGERDSGLKIGKVAFISRSFATLPRSDFRRNKVPKPFNHTSAIRRVKTEYTIVYQPACRHCDSGTRGLLFMHGQGEEEGGRESGAAAIGSAERPGERTVTSKFLTWKSIP